MRAGSASVQKVNLTLVPAVLARLGVDRLPDSCKHIGFDIGCNNGKDTWMMVEKGLCVIAVDANPMMARMTAQVNFRAIAARRVLVFNVGFDEQPGNPGGSA